MSRFNPVVRAAYSHFMTQAVPARAGHYPAGFAARTFPGDDATQAVIKGAVSPMTTDQAALVATATESFVSSLAPLSAAARLLERGLKITLHSGYDSVSIPYRTGRAAMAWVGEGNPIPAHSSLINAAQIGPLAKFAGITVHSRELANSLSSADIFDRLLREDAANALDDAVFGIQSGTDDRAAGLLSGLTPITATAGGGLAAMEGDMIKLAAEITAAGAQSVVFVAHPTLAAAVMIRKPELAEMIWSAPGMPVGRVLAMDPGPFAFASGEVDIEASANALIHMDDAAPAQIGTAGTPNVVAAPVRSTFQTDMIATRLIMDISFGMRAPGLIAYVAGASW